MRPAVAAGLLLVGLTVVPLVGCGRSAHPIAPERRLPVPATRLSAVVDLDAVVVSWTNPTTRADGSRLRDLTHVLLFRREEAMGIPPRPAMFSGGALAGYEEIARIRLDAPAPAAVEGGRVRWEDRNGLTPGRAYVYVVAARDSLGRTSLPSERLVIAFLAPPQAPGDLTAVAGEGQVSLAWRPPVELVDGAPVAGELRYLVQRATGDGALASITPEPIAATSHLDRGLQNDTEYRYAVRAVRVDPQGTALGPASPPVLASPVDTTPPAAPRDLVAIPTPGAITLSWRASPEPDVAVYAIYRATPGGDLLRIGSVVQGGSTYADREVRSGMTYRYAVTAIDRARRPNESPRSNEATATVP